MIDLRPEESTRLVVLSGAGLSAASGVPTFRDKGGLWEGHRVEEVATPGAWLRDRALVRRFYDERRERIATVLPNPGHDALARLQTRWGPERVTLITQNVDGLLTKAGAPEVIEMHGSIMHLRCESDASHPQIQIAGAQPKSKCCSVCRRPMRPAVVWFGEVPREMDRVHHALATCTLFLAVGTSGRVYPAAGFVELAQSAGATCIEVNPKPTLGAYRNSITEQAETALPELVGAWLNED